MGDSAEQLNMLKIPMKVRYEAAMVLSGVGDALGYKNGSWEFCKSGKAIQEELKSLGGLEKIKIKLPNWMISDDTVMHLATAEALIKHGTRKDISLLYTDLATKYKECMRDMKGRAPGLTCMSELHRLRPLVKDGLNIPFNARGGGCGACMRAMCIGLRYPKEEDVSQLIAVAIESGRMSHNHPTGYLGALAAALFTAYAIQGKPVLEWGCGLMDVLPKALQYVKDQGRDVKDNIEKWDYFKTSWEKYLALRNLTDGKSEPSFPADYGIEARDKFYKTLSFSGTAGSSGHDAPMIAYDALLCAGNDWEKLCKHAALHGGDSDSTGVNACCWFGALYGFQGVPECNYKKLEYKKRLIDCADKLYALSQNEAADGKQ
ncbi:unnamed protein product [Owenia fusiformis]|uniref:ADP-ribosylhydrolase ARH1 n=1 Tax=Owenia fusiformis TaxID=6347 RepID=A0A8J1Y092_OWEFU|nr:unnamed protein product [Owenia fusiformis]